MTDQPRDPFVFPIITPNGTIHATGMTLRDWFAGQALAGILARPGATHGSATQTAYDYADTMLARRRTPCP